MEEKICNKHFYFVSMFAPVIYVIFDIMQKLLQTSYSKNFEAPVFVFFLSILSPVIVSVLFFVKILFQKKSSSKVLNSLVTVLLIGGIIYFYNALEFLFFVINNPILTFIVCLQICSLIYDLFLNRG